MACNSENLRNLSASLILLGLAGYLAVRLGTDTSSPPSTSVESEILQVAPEIDPLLARRAAETWTYNALEAAKQCGRGGIEALDIFEEEAVYCLQHDATAFKALAQVTSLDPQRFRLATGPWKRAVMDWAQSGKLDHFLQELNAMPGGSLDLAEAVPDSLPLLSLKNAPCSRAMIERYGDRAWRLLVAVNFTDHPEDVERVAATIERERERVLDINDSYGLPFALLLVPPDKTGPASKTPEVVKHAIRTIDDRSVCLTLLLVNHERIMHLLDDGVSVDALCHAVDTFRSLPPIVQELSAEHRNTLQLLTEQWNREQLGADILVKCGPQATDILYKFYSSDPRLKTPALVALARLGWPAYQVLEKYRGYGKFYDFLRRAEADGLLNATEAPPYVVHAFHNIWRNGQEQLDVYASVNNLKGQVTRDVVGPLPEEAILEWMPGYVAYRAAMNWRDGYHVTGGEVFWASVDAVSTATLVYGVAVNATKSVAQRTAQQGAKAVSRTAAEEASTGLTKLGEKLSEEVLKREGAQLTRFGEKAAHIADVRLQARTKGIDPKLLGLPDRRDQFVALGKVGDINGKARLIEELGDEGAKGYASRAGYDPIFQGKPGKGMGFDHVYRDGNRIKVIEAKGGGSPLRTYRGYEQGTVENAREVAEWALRSPSASEVEKSAAKEVLAALKEGRLDVEVVRTSHVQGRPTNTIVEKIASTSPATPLGIDDLRSVMIRTPGAAVSWVRNAPQVNSALSTRAWLGQGRGVARALGLRLWQEGAGPLAERTCRRQGQNAVIRVAQQPVFSSSEQVSELAAAAMERML